MSSLIFCMICTHMLPEWTTPKIRSSSPFWEITVFADAYPISIKKTRRKTKAAGIQLVLTKSIIAWGYVDIIYYSSIPDGPLKCLLSYLWEIMGKQLWFFYPLLFYSVEFLILDEDLSMLRKALTILNFFYPNLSGKRNWVYQSSVREC